MTGALLRIKASRPSYRRAGLTFAALSWTELVEGELSDEQAMTLLADPVLTIQARADPKADWETLSAEYRRHITAALAPAVIAGDGSGEALAELDPEQLRFAELGRDLESAVHDNQDLLESLDLWPVEDPARFFLDLANRLVELGGALDRARQDCGRLTAELEALKAAQTINPADDGPDGGGGDPAAPAEVPPAEEPKPAATAGGEAGKPASKRKPAAGKKPAASKAGA